MADDPLTMRNGPEVTAQYMRRASGHGSEGASTGTKISGAVGSVLRKRFTGEAGTSVSMGNSSSGAWSVSSTSSSTGAGRSEGRDRSQRCHAAGGEHGQAGNEQVGEAADGAQRANGREDRVQPG